MIGTIVLPNRDKAGGNGGPNSSGYVLKKWIHARTDELTWSVNFQIKANKKYGWKNEEQDGPLILAYFSPSYKDFDQLLQTVEDDTTVLNRFQRFSTFTISTKTDFYVLCKREGYHDFS